MSHGVGQQVQGGFAVSPRRYDIGFDGKDFSVLGSEVRGPVYRLGGALEFPKFQQRQGPVRVT